MALPVSGPQEKDSTMHTNPSTPRGVWLPLITPFRDGALDETSARRLIRHYAARAIDGLILAATTGEGMTLDRNETESLIMLAREELTAAGQHPPLFLGLTGSDTRAGIAALARTALWPIDGYLITCPYYTRPSREGLYRHFSLLADNTAHPILIYNIPYRTGVNIENETMLRLAAHDRIVGVKDCSADPAQSFALTRDRPAGFAVLTGEDAFFHAALAQGADGGILASAHVATEDFIAVHDRWRAEDQPGALAAWRALSRLPALLFAEPNPAPIKHWLWRSGLIDSPELRLPMTQATDTLGARIDRAIAEGWAS